MPRRSRPSAQAAEGQKTFYLLSHGGLSDAFWLDWNAGAQKACDQLEGHLQDFVQRRRHGLTERGISCSAIAAKADGIATTSAQPGLWTGEAGDARAAGIPVVFFNTDDTRRRRGKPKVGADLKAAGVMRAQYLVDKKAVKKGDTVFLPVEVPGASYQQLETEGIASVFDPLGIKYDVVDCGTDPAGIISKMSDYMLEQLPAIIALGDPACRRQAGSTARVLPRKIPVVGWGN